MEEGTGEHGRSMRRAGVVVLAALLVAGLAGLALRMRGGTDIVDDELTVLLRVGEATRERGTFRFEHTRVAVFRTSEPGTKDLRYEVRRDADIDLTNDIADVRMLIMWPGWAEDAGDRVPPCRFISASDVFFYEVPEEHRGHFDGRRWLPSTDPVSGLGTLDFAQQVDAAAGLGWMEEAEGWRRVGHAEHRGTPVTRYQGVIPAPTPSPYDDGSAVEGESQIEAWIDDEGLLRRLEAEQEIVGTPSVQIHDVMEFFDYGVPAGFTAPAEAEIFTGEVANPTQVCMGVHPDEAR